MLGVLCELPRWPAPPVLDLGTDRARSRSRSPRVAARRRDRDRPRTHPASLRLQENAPASDSATGHSVGRLVDAMAPTNAEGRSSNPPRPANGTRARRVREYEPGCVPLDGGSGVARSSTWPTARGERPLLALETGGVAFGRSRLARRRATGTTSSTTRRLATPARAARATTDRPAVAPCSGPEGAPRRVRAAKSPALLTAPWSSRRPSTPNSAYSAADPDRRVRT